jgi:hypothetical protein
MCLASSGYLCRADIPTNSASKSQPFRKKVRGAIKTSHGRGFGRANSTSAANSSSDRQKLPSPLILAHILRIFSNVIVTAPLTTDQRGALLNLAARPFPYTHNRPY